jgi:hypothetical protein
MRRDPRLEIITHAIEGLIPGATPANMTVRVFEDLPNGLNIWDGRPDGLAEKVFTALYGRPKDVDDRRPLAQAEDAKRARDIVGEVGALMSAGAALESAPWYPTRPGDLVHVHYEASGRLPAHGEMYIVGAADDSDSTPAGLMSLQLLAHTLPAAIDPAEVGGGCYAVEAVDCPIYELWFEAGPQRLTIVRDGRVVHDGGRR